MKKQNYIISIPEPCHEDWNSMTPDANGKFCNSCSKSVIDFTNKTDTEIHNMMIARKNERICGHFKKTQVNRPLSLHVSFYALPQNMSPAMVFAIALFLVFGTFLFSCTNEHNQKIDEISITEPESLIGITMGEPMMPLIEVPNDSVTSSEYETSKISCSSFTNGGVNYTEVSIVDSLSEIPVQDTMLYMMDKEYTITGAMMYYEPGIYEKPDTNFFDRRMKMETIIPNDNVTFQVYPNPTNGSFNISYEVTKRGNVQVDIFDIKGILVKTLVSQQNQYEGKYTIPTDVSDLVNGTYICRIIYNGNEKSTKLIIAK